MGMNRRWKRLKLLMAATVTGIILLASGNGLAQTSRNDRIRERELEEQDITQRSWNLRMLSIMAAQTKPRKMSPQLALAQLQEDFTRIQEINKPLGLMALGKASLDLKFVTTSATEINKRAERLKKNLALPESPDAGSAPKRYTVNNPSQLKAPIVSLARLILDFTSNPFFKEASVVDTTAYQARRDLEVIIQLSAEVRDLSKKLAQESASHR